MKKILSIVLCIVLCFVLFSCGEQGKKIETDASDIPVINNNDPYTFEEIWAIVEKHKNGYGLCENPFTRMICTRKEYADSRLEYERELMMERYGHCDGLD